MKKLFLLPTTLLLAISAFTFPVHGTKNDTDDTESSEIVSYRHILVNSDTVLKVTGDITGHNIEQIMKDRPSLTTLTIQSNDVV